MAPAGEERTSVIDMTVELLEPMGNEVFVSRRGPHAVVARVQPQQLPAPGEPVAARVHLFDADTGERIVREVDDTSGPGGA